MTPRYMVAHDFDDRYQIVAQIGVFDVFIRRAGSSKLDVFEAGIEWGKAKLKYSDTVTGILVGVRRKRPRTGQRMLDQIAAVLSLMGVPE